MFVCRWYDFIYNRFYRIYKILLGLMKIFSKLEGYKVNIKLFFFTLGIRLLKMKLGKKIYLK